MQFAQLPTKLSCPNDAKKISGISLARRKKIKTPLGGSGVHII